MSEIFFTSDWHFNHNKEFIYKPRGFDSVYDMNEAIIENHNRIVNMDDIVYVLGDLCLGGGSDEILRKNKSMIQNMKGQLKVILGNHDTNTRIQMYNECWNVEVLGYADIIKYKKYHFYISHFPTKVGNYDDEEKHKKFYSLCGHTHTKDKLIDFNECKAYHIEIDAHNNKPILLDQIIQDINLYGQR